MQHDILAAGNLPNMKAMERVTGIEPATKAWEAYGRAFNSPPTTRSNALCSDTEKSCRIRTKDHLIRFQLIELLV